MADAPKGRPKTQIAFSDVVIGDDEELAKEARIYRDNAPSEVDSERASKRKKAAARIRDILLNRHKELLAVPTESPDGKKGWSRPDGSVLAWIAVKDAAGNVLGYLTPKLRHFEEDKKVVTHYPGGADKVEFAFQLSPSTPADVAPDDE